MWLKGIGEDRVSSSLSNKTVASRKARVNFIPRLFNAVSAHRRADRRASRLKTTVEKTVDKSLDKRGLVISVGALINVGQGLVPIAGAAM